MRTSIIEVTQTAEFNWGKFLVGEFDQADWERKSALPTYPDNALLPSTRSLLRQIGWTPSHILVVDLQTGEGVIFDRFTTSPRNDLNQKHQVWVCPMFEPFLEWLVAQRFTSVADLPAFVELETGEAAVHGYRRSRTA